MRKKKAQPKAETIDVSLVEFSVKNFRNIRERNYVFPGDCLDVLYAKDRALLDAMAFFSQYVKDSPGGQDTLAKWGGPKEIASYYTPDAPVIFEVVYRYDREAVRYEVSFKPEKWSMTVISESLVSNEKEIFRFEKGKAITTPGLAPNGELRQGALALNAYGTFVYSPIREIFKDISSWKIYSLDLANQRPTIGWCSEEDILTGRNLNVMLNEINRDEAGFNDFQEAILEAYPVVKSISEHTSIDSFILSTEIDNTISVRIRFKEDVTFELPLRNIPKDLLYSIAMIAIIIEAGNKENKPKLIAFKEPFAYIDEKYTYRVTAQLRKLAVKQGLTVLLHTKDFGNVTEF